MSGRDDKQVYTPKEAFERRASISVSRNGKPFSGYISVNIATWKAVIGLVGAFLALIGVVTETVRRSFNVFARPTVEAIAREQAEPIAATLSAHVVESERAHTTFLSRLENDKLRAEDRESLAEMKRQIEFLYQNEIRAARGR